MSTELAFVTFLIFGLYLTWTDLQTHRLPNKQVLLVTIVCSVLVGFNRQAIQVGLLYFAIFLGLAVLPKSSIGMGDVKYAYVCGLLVGALNPTQAVFGLWLMFGISASVVLIMLIARRVEWHSHIAFGPYMTLGVVLIALNSLT